MNSNFPRFCYEGCVYMCGEGKLRGRLGRVGGSLGGAIDSIHAFGESV